MDRAHKPPPTVAFPGLNPFGTCYHIHLVQHHLSHVPSGVANGSLPKLWPNRRSFAFWLTEDEINERNVGIYGPLVRIC
jgi:hypothetical protein